MEVRTETERTYWLGMTETQARDLLTASVTYSDWVKAFPDVDRTDDQSSQFETLQAIRQTLLNAGVTLKEPG